MKSINSAVEQKTSNWNHAKDYLREEGFSGVVLAAGTVLLSFELEVVIETRIGGRTSCVVGDDALEACAT